MNEPSTTTYDRVAERWHELRRQDLVEREWLERFAASLPRGGRILDVGCGTGQPIAAWLLGAGFAVVGVDASSRMIERAKSELPGGTWWLADMRALPDLGRFDGAISWDGLFHLSAADQRVVLPLLCSVIEPPGSMLLTIGPSAGEVSGAVDGSPVAHASLAPDEYELLLRDRGFTNVEIVVEDPRCSGHSVVLATGRGEVCAETPVG